MSKRYTLRDDAMLIGIVGLWITSLAVGVTRANDLAILEPETISTEQPLTTYFSADFDAYTLALSEHEPQIPYMLEQ